MIPRDLIAPADKELVNQMIKRSSRVPATSSLLILEVVGWVDGASR
jgi:hypothetical protein